VVRLAGTQEAEWGQHDVERERKRERERE